MQAITSTEFHYVSEQEDVFLSLFPHRFDYIWADHPEPDQKVDWQTERRHPLSDRQIRQGSSLFGVRFGSETNYCMLDIDAGSRFHPDCDRFALSRILATLEPLGLVASVACTSSYSGGLHVYFPTQDLHKSWELALTVSTLLERSGFKLTPGQLELFPNPRPYSSSHDLNLYNAHRLPLQIGSYLLNDQLEPIWSSDGGFTQQWQMAQGRNDLNRNLLKQVLRQIKQNNSYRLSGKADKFIQDLNIEIATGWTGSGQTNYLLGRITMRAYIFHAILTGEAPLTGQALVNEVVKTAQALPGYCEWCSHQHEIEARVVEWATCIEASRYFPYGFGQGKFKAKSTDSSSSETSKTNWNQVQSDAARDRIRQALAHLLETGSLPATSTARFQLLTQAGVGGGSLYRHKDLWHPKYLMPAQDVQDVLTQAVSIQNVATALEVSGENDCLEKSRLTPVLPQEGLDCAVGASNPPCCTSLLSTTGSNQPASNTLADVAETAIAPAGRNHCRQGALPVPSPVIHGVKTWLVAQMAAAKAARAECNRQHQSRQQASRKAAQQTRAHCMRQFLASGDPILMAEAWAWMEAHPEWHEEGKIKEPPS